ncbi:YIP1 family protein [Wenyingzhuangia sp. 2_MG-2023]|uniref:YIP1 family protein n=1 Tax=Wenyingzhuangia sp. 2_MG-2023 TaxID=3062639 RepID=UPI0026E34179|nr:YIP1 family protein [Wenyingzhuangia sp. 2_MG-2023]MDO6739408.1 YIP1 family protein [Wenyingzhuangia sp. 2_MG-2023]MDO6804115.1 YIP1 family protein [Wenyingzhuangia sp. 1_MG-2023]
MNSFIQIFINSKKAFKNIENDFSDELHTKSIIVFVIYGLLSFIEKFSIENKKEGFFLQFSLLIMKVSLTILILLLFSYLIYWIGKKLKGVAEYIDIESVVAHSLIPLIISSIIILVLKKTIIFDSNWNNEYLRNSVIIITNLISLRILYLGSKRFNKFSLKKSLISISPKILVYVGTISLIIYLMIR